VQEPVERAHWVSAFWMEIAMVVLAVFALIAGFINTPAYTALHDFLAPTLLEEPETIDFNFLPMLVSIVLALGGLTLGWWVYGRRPVREGQTDPTERALGGEIWRTLQNRLYLDYTYRRFLLRPAQWLADYFVIQVVDRETIDELLHSIAAGFTWLGEAFKRFNTVVIDGAVDGLVYGIGDFARWFRQTQTGRIQQYLLFVTLALLVIGTLFLLQA
jgi:NADH-quinone oxidoreductase subunit L